MRRRDHGRKRAFFYACSTYRRRGKTIRANSDEVPLALADDKVLAIIEQDLLQPQVVERALARTLEILKGEGGASAAQRELLGADLLKIEKELENLGGAIAQAGPPALFRRAG